jgi:phenylpyruvate tautomerase PptA (4-oxalocrotonate tautomerase family)
VWTIVSGRQKVACTGTRDRVGTTGEITLIDRVTQAQYDALGTPDAETLYVVVD